VHRDYAAHVFRWGFAFKWIKYQKTRVLDIGCGQECPLARTLNFRQAAVPGLWVGVDLNKIDKPFKAKWASVHDQFSFVDRHKELVKEYGSHSFDLVVCFEVMEHMHPDDGLRLLRAAADLAAVGAVMLLSTPVFNEKRMAANHIHEYSVDELETLIIKSGRWSITRRHGTFSSWNELKKVITPQERELYEELLHYYDHEVLSCFLAPKYPDASRNNVWVLTKRGAR
jgi:SAM-dependent methyltransferase